METLPDRVNLGDLLGGAPDEEHGQGGDQAEQDGRRAQLAGAAD